jgi:hypothetical protein
MKPIIGSHYTNDDHRLYSFQRRADPPWHPQEWYDRHWSHGISIHHVIVGAAIVGLVGLCLSLAIKGVL